MGAELAHFGVVVDPPTQGVADSVKGFDALGKAADAAAARLESFSKSQGGTAVRATDAHTSAMQRALASAGVLLRALGPVGDQALLMASRFERAGLAMEQMEVSAAKARGGMATTAIAVGGVIGALAALALGIDVIKKTWELFTGTIGAASARLRESFNFKFLIGDASEAALRMRELNAVFEQSGVKSFAQFGEAAKFLLLTSTGTKNLTERLREMGEIAVATGSDVTEVARAYEMIRQAIFRGAEIQTRAGGVGGLALKALLQALQVETGKTEDALQRAFKQGTIRIEDVNRAMKDLTTNTGRFATASSEWLATFPGKVDNLSKHWLIFKEMVGAPIIDALTPVIDQLTKKLGDVDPLAKRIGDSLAAMIGRIDTSITDGKFGDLLEATFKSAVESLNSYLETKYKSLWHAVFYEVPKAEWQAFQDWYRKANETTWGDVGGVILRDMTKTRDNVKTVWQWLFDFLRDAWAKSEFGIGTPSAAGGTLGSLLNPPTNEAMVLRPTTTFYPMTGTTGGGTEDPLTKRIKELQVDEDMMTAFRKSVEDVNSALGSGRNAVEAERRLFELASAAAGKLVAPTQHETELINAQLTEVDKLTIKWEVQYAERMQAEKQWEAQARAGLLSFSDTARLALQKVSDSIGSWQTQMVSAIQGIAGALSTGISGGLTDILDGTKTLAQGFKDMALSIIKDIERIIIKMLIELAIQQLLSAFGYSGGVGTYTGGGRGYQRGGTIYGGGGTRDDVPIMATAGEYVLTQGDVRRLGGAGRIDQWRRGYQHGGELTVQQAGRLTGGIDPSIRYDPRVGGYVNYDPSIEPAFLPGATASGGGAPAGMIYDPVWGWLTPISQGGVDIYGGGPTVETPTYQSPSATIYGGGPSTTATSGYPIPGWNIPSGTNSGWVQNASRTSGGGHPYGYVSPTSAASINFRNQGLAFAGNLAGLGLGQGLEAFDFEATGAKNAIRAAKGLPSIGGGLGASGKTGARFYWSGGLVEMIPSFQGGGVMPHTGLAMLHEGERVIPTNAGQSIQQNSIVINVVNNNGQATTTAQGSGLDSSDAREIARLVVRICDERIVRARRPGGEMYVSRAG